MRCNEYSVLVKIYLRIFYTPLNYNRGIKHYLKLATIRNLSRNMTDSRNIKMIKITICNINQKLIMNQL